MFEPVTNTPDEFVTLALTDGWSLVPAMRNLEHMWDCLGTDESSYIGLRFKLAIREDQASAEPAAEDGP